MIENCGSDALAEFLAEAKLMAAIPDHPNVLRFIGLVTSNARPSIVTEFCAGSSLLNAIEQQELDDSTLWHVVRGVAGGMAHLAAANIAHRDLACRVRVVSFFLFPFVLIFFVRLFSLLTDVDVLQNILLDEAWNPKVCDVRRSNSHRGVVR
jgi:serine/threonine protein kinase